MQQNSPLRHQLEALDKLVREQLDTFKTSSRPELLETDLLKDTLKELYLVVDQLYKLPVVLQSEPVPPVQVEMPEPEPVTTPVLTPVPVLEQKTEITEAKAETGVLPEISVSKEMPLETEALPEKEIRRDLQETRKSVYSESLSKSLQNEEQVTIGSRYKAEETLSERITATGVPRRLSDELQRKPLEDLRVSIGLNERFAIINELFGGNQQGFYAAIDTLNNASSFEAAESALGQLSAENGWTSYHPRVIEFTELVRRRFGI